MSDVVIRDNSSVRMNDADDPAAGASLAPTDVAQFIRLDQCERYLRLRLHQRAAGLRFMRAAGVVPQVMPPLLTLSGQRFEARLAAAIAARYPTLNLATGGRERADDHAAIVEQARALPPGGVVVLLQARLRVELAGWLLRGDIDVLRLARAPDGQLQALIADIKSSASPRVEHRLQIAFYQAMLARLADEAGLGPLAIESGILFRGPASATGDEAEIGQRAAALAAIGTDEARLEITADPATYLEAVDDLVTAADSTANRVARMPFAEIPFHLTYKCDDCLYNEFCMKWCAERDDLSLLPHLGATEKTALRRAGVATMRQLATLKEARPSGADAPAAADSDLMPAPGREQEARRLAVTWPIGPRLDELIHRARRYRAFKGDDLTAPPTIPGGGHGSLPYCDAGHNPNLIRVYIDAQHDHLHDRLYLLGALVVANEGGVAVPTRRRSIVHLTDGPPNDPAREERLFLAWTGDLLAAVVELAAPDAEGQPRAPIHLIFYNQYEQRLLLDGLGRHLPAILGATPLYDFITQLAAFDSPIATFLDQEIRDHKNYPMVCQSLQAVAAFLRFNWNDPGGPPYRTLFHARLFDFWGRLDGGADQSGWYTNRARFGSQIPLEYAYGAWGELPPPAANQRDDFAPFRATTSDHLIGFQARRLAALEHIARDFPGNQLTQKAPFDLPKLAEFDQRARTLAQALAEFLTIERHVALTAWKRTRHLPPERRALLGETLVVRYVESDQPPEVATRNQEHERRRQARAALLAADPEVTLSKEQRSATAIDQEGLRLRLRLEMADLDCSLDELLALATPRAGDPLVLYPRTTVDERLPADQRTPFTPTPRQMLYGTRASLLQMTVERDAAGAAIGATVEIELRGARGSASARGFVFSASASRPLVDGQVYTLDPDPNDWYAAWCLAVVEAVRASEERGQVGRHALYDRLTSQAPGEAAWPAAAATGQARFLAGLDALRAAGLLHEFEPAKRAYIGELGQAPLLLVQGPPGTGKSYATAFALLARLQGAMAADLDYRALVACKTHAATDVLLENIRAVRERLVALQAARPDLFAAHFDARLLTVPLYRLTPREAPPPGVIGLPRDDARPKGTPRAAEVLGQARWGVVAATPGGVYRLVKDRWGNDLLGHHLCHGLVLDEASQMNLPEGLMAALLLRPDGHLIVVGDHRQMPPIIQHDWALEPRRTFQHYRAYESLFLTLLPRGGPQIKFAESFRLHADMAEFLRQEIYRHDGIPYFSRRHDLLPITHDDDPFVAAVLSPAHPLVVVVHDETGSQVRNPFEEALLLPLLTRLADPAVSGLDARAGLGVVVPHRAQRAALQAALPLLTVRDAVTGAVVLSAVDTVERFQGGERTVILVSATESDRDYLLASSQFLLDPRRLTVALSRAKRKVVLVASRSVFALFSADAETFANAQLWKHLLRRTCTHLLWRGDRHGHAVEVWGNLTGM